MNVDAFLLIGELVKDKRIEAIVFGKEEFGVTFKNEISIIAFNYNKESILGFLELLETY